MEKIKLCSGLEVGYNYWLADAEAESRPILISFHGWSGGGGHHPVAEEFKEQYKHWNIFSPSDRSGVARSGGWWLGENRQFFMLEAIDKLVSDIRERFSLQKDIYAWGSSMGGFGALLHGFRCKFKAVAVNVPQVRLIGSDYMALFPDKLSAIWDPSVVGLSIEEAERKAIGGEDPDLALSDATCFLDMENPRNNPVVFISQTRHDTSPLYLKQQTLYLVDRLMAAGCNFELYVEPRVGHYVVRDCHQVLALFEKFRDVIENPVDIPKLPRDQCYPASAISISS